MPEHWNQHTGSDLIHDPLVAAADLFLRSPLQIWQNIIVFIFYNLFGLIYSTKTWCIIKQNTLYLCILKNYLIP